MAAESAFVAIPLGHEQPPTPRNTASKGCRELLVLVAITAVLLLCQIHQNVLFVDRKQDSSTPQAIKWEEAEVIKIDRIYTGNQDKTAPFAHYSEDYDDNDDGIISPHRAGHKMNRVVDPVTSSEHPSRKVVTLTDDTFDSFTHDHDVVFVAFIVPCTLCSVTKRLEETWTKFASQAPTEMVVAKVDCEESTDTCRNQVIQGLRTLRLYQYGSFEDYSNNVEPTVNQLVEFSKTRLHPSPTPLVTLTDETFDSYIQEHDVIFVDFYAPWCAWSQRLLPTWDKFASKASKLPMFVAKVDCVEHAETCRNQKVMAFPTLRWYQNGVPIAPDYKMERTVDALIKFSKIRLNMILDDSTEDTVRVDSSISDQEVSSKSKDDDSIFDNASEEEDSVDDDSTEDTISDSLSDQEVSRSESEDDDEGDLSAVTFYPSPPNDYSREAIEEYPQHSKDVIISPPKLPDSIDEWSDEEEASEEEEEEEDRDLSANSFQQSPSNDYPREADQDSQEDSKDSIRLNQGRPCKDPGNKAIFESSYSASLTNVNFQDYLKENSLVFVDFYAPWCIWSQRLAPTWNDFALSMHHTQPTIRVAQVDCVAYADLCHQQGILAFPTLRLYRQGTAITPDYKLDRTVSAFTSYVTKYIVESMPRAQESIEASDYDSIEDSEDSIEDLEVPERIVVPNHMKPVESSAADKETREDYELEDYVEEEDFGVQLPRWVTTLW